MTIRVFQYPLPCEPELSDLNHFLASQKIVSLHREIVSGPQGPLLVFIVQSLGSESPPRPSKPPPDRIDYQALLGDAGYAVYNELRDERARLAQIDRVALFKIFTNAHFVAMVQQRCVDRAALRRIPGISEAKIRKFGDGILTILQQNFGTEPASPPPQTPPPVTVLSPFPGPSSD